MKKHTLSFLLVLAMCLPLLPVTALAAGDADNGDWSQKSVVLKNTAEAELMVRSGDIDALNDANAIANGYSPFTAKNQRPHGYRGGWNEDADDPSGTDRMYVGSKWTGREADGYAEEYTAWINGRRTGKAFGEGALTIKMSYDTDEIAVKTALLQLCIDDFQPLTWGSRFTVSLNGKDAPFIAELLNNVDQTGPVSYMVSAVIPTGFLADVASGSLVVAIDETTGVGDGFAVDFAKLLVNYEEALFTGEFDGTTEPGATVRLLGTSTTVTAAGNGGFSFEAIPGLNAVRASKDGFCENYEFGIVLASDTQWEPDVALTPGTGDPDIDFSKFGATDAWADASEWATSHLQQADELGLIPEELVGADMTRPIDRREFAAVCVKVYEALGNITALPAVNDPFTDTNDIEVLKAYNVGITAGTGDGTTFSPDNLLSRQEMSTMLTNTYKRVFVAGWQPGVDYNHLLDYEAYMAEHPFVDHEHIDGWARASVYFMAKHGIVSGLGSNKFGPKNVTTQQEAEQYANATREQALTVAVGLVKNFG